MAKWQRQSPNRRYCDNVSSRILRGIDHHHVYDRQRRFRFECDRPGRVGSESRRRNWNFHGDFQWNPRGQFNRHSNIYGQQQFRGTLTSALLVFRFYECGQSDLCSRSICARPAYQFNNIVNETAVVPEPPSVVLSGLALIASLGYAGLRYMCQQAVWMNADNAASPRYRFLQPGYAGHEVVRGS
jgi:hypothetical protein